MKSHHSSGHHRLKGAVIAAVVAFSVLFALTMLGDDDGPPTCPVSRTGGVDLVPSGARPCILYGSSSAVSGSNSGSGHSGIPRGSEKTAAPRKPQGSEVRKPAAPKASALPRTVRR